MIPCLSLRQPWAWLVVHGGKDIENRKWNTKHRGTFLIHAAKGMTGQEWADAWSFARAAGFGNEIPLNPERGGIVGAARLDCVVAPGPTALPWHMKDQHGFVLQNITPLPFRAHKGALGFFKVELTATEEEALRQGGLL